MHAAAGTAWPAVPPSADSSKVPSLVHFLCCPHPATHHSQERIQKRKHVATKASTRREYRSVRTPLLDPTVCVYGAVSAYMYDVRACGKRTTSRAHSIVPTGPESVPLPGPGGRSRVGSLRRIGRWPGTGPAGCRCSSRGGGCDAHHWFLLLNSRDVLLGFSAPFDAMSSSMILTIEVRVSWVVIHESRGSSSFSLPLGANPPLVTGLLFWSG
jgi:hypothetical protein